MPLLNQLNTLETMGLIRLAAVQPELEYLFRHALLQDAAYASLLKSDRKQLHLATCQALEKLYPEQTDDLAAMLAYHYEKAEDSERAAYHFRRAGDHARRSYANIEALGFYRSAARLLRVGPLTQGQTDLAPLCEDMGDLLEILGQHEAAREQFAVARSFLSEAETFACARLYRKAAYTWSIQHELNATFQACADAEAALGPAAATELWQQEWLEIQLARHWALYALNQAEELQASIDHIRAVLEQYGTPAQQVRFYSGLIALGHRLHRYAALPEDIAHGEAGLAAAHRSGNMRSIADAEWTLGVAYLLGSYLDEAETHLQASLQIVEKVGDLVTEIRSLTYLVVLYRRKGNLKAAREMLPRLVKIATDGQMAMYVAAATATGAWLAWREAQLTEAEANSLAAIATWQEMLPLVYPFQWQALWVLIAVTVQQCQIAAAIEYAQKLIAPGQQALPADLQASLVAGIQAWEADQAEVAQQHLAIAIQQAQAQGYL